MMDAGGDLFAFAATQKRDEQATHDIKARVHRNMGSKAKPGGRAYWAGKAREFRAQNPHVWAAFVELTVEMLAVGHRKLGVELIFNVIRWKTMLKSVDDTGFKLNSNYKTEFSRMFMAEYPQYGAVFNTREEKGSGAEI